MTVTVAVLDANVLYPALLRDLLLQLSFEGLFQARWSTEIENEWRRNLLRARPELTAQIERTQIVMRRAMPEALVNVRANRARRFVLPDPNDQHVLAAALQAKAHVIVTFNLKDFPAAALAGSDVDAVHPDAFLCAIIAGTPRQVLVAVGDCIGRLNRPPVAADDYLRALRRLGLLGTADFLEAHRVDWQPDR